MGPGSHCGGKPVGSSVVASSDVEPGPVVEVLVLSVFASVVRIPVPGFDVLFVAPVEEDVPSEEEELADEELPAVMVPAVVELLADADMVALDGSVSEEELLESIGVPLKPDSRVSALSPEHPRAIASRATIATRERVCSARVCSAMSAGEW